MAGSSFGSIFRITTWGESHGAGLGVVVDGCPAGLPLCEEDIQIFLNRRKPGQSKFATPRKEDDTVEILSGVFEGKTTGTPISMLVRTLPSVPVIIRKLLPITVQDMPTTLLMQKYGFRDYRGGGRSSGRETIGRVAAGAVASKLLATLGISLTTYTRSIGPVTIKTFDRTQIEQNKLYMPDADAAAEASAYLLHCMKEQNSSGGIVECIVNGLPTGLGDPVFEKLDANLGKAILSIGAVKAFEIGDGMAVASATGRSNNDPFLPGENGAIRKASNHAGGVLGGISDGSPLILRAAIKPTPSIASFQDTVNKQGKPISVSIKGRHDPIIVPRAVVVVESMTALVLADALLLNMTATMDNVKKIYTDK